MSEPDTSLGAALGAYAAATSGELLNAPRVRARVLQSVRAPRRGSRRRLSFVLPLVAAFAASAAFAATHPAVRSGIAVRLEAMLRSAPAAPKQGHSSSSPRVVPAVSALATPVASSGTSSESAAPIAVADLPLAPPNLGRPHADAVPTSPVASSSSQADAQLLAYRTAHRTHFDSGDAHTALAAWDDYLEQFPAGSFADDARFNRALCLIRLGQLTAARAALSSFAAAPTGSYRQAEAASLLQGLDAPAPSSGK